MKICLKCGKRITIRERLSPLLCRRGITCFGCGTEYREIIVPYSILRKITAAIIGITILMYPFGMFALNMALFVLYVPAAEFVMSHFNIYVPVTGEDERK